MKFSIVVPVYNVEKYLKKCLDSIFEQQFEDYEVIAVDDGSTDKSNNILNEYIQKSTKLKVIHQENKGLGGARNTGIENARGEYLVFLDSDDYIDSKMLMVLNDYLEKYNLDILAFDCSKVDENYNFMEKVSYDNFKNKYSSLSKKNFLCLNQLHVQKYIEKNYLMIIMLNFQKNFGMKILQQFLNLYHIQTISDILKKVFIIMFNNLIVSLIV